MPFIPKDEQIASLASLLEPASYSNAQYVHALTRADGNLELAAERLLLSCESSSSRSPSREGREGVVYDGGRKRKQSRSPDGTLSGWLTSGKAAVKRRQQTPPPAAEVSPDKALRSYLSVLQSTSPVKTTDDKRLRAPPRPPIILTTPRQIASTLPTISLEQSPLSPEFASALFLTLMEESKNWKKFEWYLAGRLVESGHTSCFYRLREDAANGEYWYAGKIEPEAPTFPPILRQAVDIINPFVNDILAARPARYDIEYGGRWRANVAAVNHYEGGASSVGWHADQLTYLGPYTTIVSLSLGVTRNFRLRDTPGSAEIPRTYEIPLQHNTIVIMHGGTQEKYKHTIPPVGKGKAIDLYKPAWAKEGQHIPVESRVAYNSRLNVTFRFYRPDFHPSPGYRPTDGKSREGTPLCKCGVPTTLRADQKGKVRGVSWQAGTKALEAEMGGSSEAAGQRIIRSDLAFFYQCQSQTMTGEMKGCNYFRLLSMEQEGRGPCLGGTEHQDVPRPK